MSVQDMQGLLTAAFAPAQHTCIEQHGLVDTNGKGWSSDADYPHYSDEVYRRLEAQRFLEVNRAAVRSLLLRLPAASSLSGSMLQSLLRECIKQGRVDTTKEMLALPVTQKRLSPEELVQLCVQCADDDARQYDNAWQGQKEVVEALLQHPAARQFDIPALQRLVAAFGSAFPAHHYGTEFHPLALVLRPPVAQSLDATALLAVLTACIEVHVPISCIAAGLAAAAVAQWSAQQVRGLLETAACVRHARAFSRLLQHPAAPAASDPEMQALAAVMSSANPREDVPVSMVQPEWVRSSWRGDQHVWNWLQQNPDSDASRDGQQGVVQQQEDVWPMEELGVDIGGDNASEGGDEQSESAGGGEASESEETGQNEGGSEQDDDEGGQGGEGDGMLFFDEQDDGAGTMDAVVGDIQKVHDVGSESESARGEDD